MGFLGRFFFIVAFLFASPVFSQSLVFEGNSLIDSEEDSSSSSGFGSNLRELQERTPVITVEPVIRIPRESDGHFYATVRVNGVEIRFLVDTGASNIGLSKDDARRAGIDLFYLKFSMQAVTANGTIKIAPVKLRSIFLGEQKQYDFPAFVLDGNVGFSLLGMSYLSLYSQIEISNEYMMLHP